MAAERDRTWFDRLVRLAGEEIADSIDDDRAAKLTDAFFKAMKERDANQAETVAAATCLLSFLLQEAPDSVRSAMVAWIFQTLMEGGKKAA